MTKIQDAFDRGKAFIPYITAGYPNLEMTEKIILTLVEKGADLIEIGIPFSDPTAEGPVIQHAIEEALSQGLRTDQVFDMVERIRSQVDVPLVFMTYANIVFGYGLEKFMKRSQAVGIQGLILPDVPFEEKNEFSEVANRYDVDMISLISPTSKDRVSQIAKEAQGFIYVVSSLGVTGVRPEITTDLEEIITRIRKANTDIPTAIGFGISDPDQAQQMVKYADGVIVGSSIVKMLDGPEEVVLKDIADFTQSIKDVI